MKTCPRCETEKPLDEFNKYSASPDGRQGYCRPCNREAMHAARRRRTATVEGVLEERLQRTTQHACRGGVRTPSWLARELAAALCARHPEVTLENVHRFEVDHRIPVSTFVFEAGGSFSGPDDPLFLECNSLDNLHLVPKGSNRLRYAYMRRAEREGRVDMTSVADVRDLLADWGEAA